MTPRSEARAVASTPARHETTYATPSDHELVITRTFDAPRSLVWSVFTDPKHVPNWHTGPAGFTMPVCEIDLRAGGAWRDVDPPNRLVSVTIKNDVEQPSTTTFIEHNGRTTVTLAILFASKEARDQGLPYAKIGTEPDYARLDEYLAHAS